MKYTREQWENEVRELGFEPKTDEQLAAEVADINQRVTGHLLPLADADVRPLIERYLAELASMEENLEQKSDLDDDGWRVLIADLTAMYLHKYNEEQNELQSDICTAMTHACYSHGYDRFVQITDRIAKAVAA